MWGAAWTAVHIGVMFTLKILRGLIMPYFLASAGYGVWASIGVLLDIFNFRTWEYGPSWQNNCQVYCYGMEKLFIGIRPHLALLGLYAYAFY